MHLLRDPLDELQFSFGALMCARECGCIRSCRFISSPNAAIEGRRPGSIPALANAQGKFSPTEIGLKARHQIVCKRVSRWIGPSALVPSLVPNLGRRSCLALAQAVIKPGRRPSDAVFWVKGALGLPQGRPRIAHRFNGGKRWKKGRKPRRGGRNRRRPTSSSVPAGTRFVFPMFIQR